MLFRSLFLFTFLVGEHCMPTKIETGSRGGLSPVKRLFVEQFPTNRRKIEYKEFRKGEMFPSKVALEFFKWLPAGASGVRGQMYDEGTTRICTVTECRLNEDLPKGAFDVHLPVGTKVVDRIEGKTYRTPRWLNWWWEWQKPQPKRAVPPRPTPKR